MYKCWPFMVVAPLLGAPGASFLLELLGGCGCFSGKGEISGGDKKVLDVGCTVHPSKLSAKRLHVHFSLHCFFSNWLFQPDFTGLTYFILGAWAEEGEINVFLSPSTFLQVTGLLFLFPG